MDDLKDFYELRALYAINSSVFYFTSMTLGHELKALGARNRLGLWMT